MLKVISKPFRAAKNKVCDLCNGMKKYKIFHYTIFQIYFLAFLTTIIIEILSKRSLFKGIAWFFTHPIEFVINILIVAVTYSIFIFVRRKYAWYFLVFILWLAIGVVDCVVISCRITPFTFGDVKVLPSVIEIIPMYLSPFKMVLAGIGIVAAIIVLVIGCIKLPVLAGDIRRVGKIMLAVVLVTLNSFAVASAMKIGLIETNFKNIRNAYQQYGLAYCYANSIVNTGVTKPSGYSKDKVDKIIDNISPTQDVKPPVKPEDDNSKPNVIFIQLESFFNVNRINGATYASNPIPFMTYLYNNYQTGLLEVPSISAGTANTEFEILTGMNMADFGPGEYPYKTVLSERDIQPESLANNLRQLGYRTHAIHNNTASFYNRNIVFPKLGFEKFTSIEFMTGIERNHLNWCKDKILTEQINSALDSTAGRDFVFAVSVQGHGTYPDEDVLNDESLLVSLEGVSGEVGQFNFAYYLEQLNEMDKFVEELVGSLEKREEPTVLVLYGDHLPGFDFEEEDLSIGSLYETEYVIWKNYKTSADKASDKDLKSYQLSAYVMSLLGYDEGIITKLHQSKDKYSESEYLADLQVLEYDMLYGDLNCWDGECPYILPELKYGYGKIGINDLQMIKNKEDGVNYGFIKGNGFNEYSTIFLNKKDKLTTIFVDENTLFVPEIKVAAGDVLYVSQSSSSVNAFPLGVPYVITEENADKPYSN